MSTGNEKGSATNTWLNGFKSDSQQTISTYLASSAANTVFPLGHHERFNPQLYYYIGPFGLLAEWLREYQELSNGLGTGALNNRRGTSPLGSAIGGDETYEGVKPHHPASIAERTFGALEIGLRYERLNIDTDVPDGGRSPQDGPPGAGRGVALNWRLTRNIKRQGTWGRAASTAAPANSNLAKEKVGLGALPGQFLRHEREDTMNETTKRIGLTAAAGALRRRFGLVAIVGGPRAASAPRRRRDGQAAQRLLRSDARAVPGRQHGLRQALEAEDRADVNVNQSHGGSGKQARAVIDGLEADVVTLALAYDIDAIAVEVGAHRRGLAEAAARQQRRRSRRRWCSWCARATRNGIHDWDDLIEAGRRRRRPPTRRPRAARAGTTWRPGATRCRTAATRPRPRSSCARCTRTCRCSTRARAARR